MWLKRGALMTLLVRLLFYTTRTTAQFRSTGISFGITTVKGGVPTEERRVSCSDFANEYRHVSTLELYSNGRMRTACVCSVKAPSEHYPMTVTLNQPGSDDSDLPRLQLAADIWRYSSELTITIAKNNMTAHACGLHYQQNLPASFAFSNEAGALLSCKEVRDVELVPKAICINDQPVGDQPDDDTSASMPLSVVGYIAGICLVAIILINVMVTVSIKYGCARRRRVEVTGSSQEQGQVNEISHSASMDFGRDENGAEEEEEISVTSSTFVSNAIHNSPSHYLVPQNQYPTPTITKTKPLPVIPKKYSPVRTDLDVFVSPVYNAINRTEQYSYAYDESHNAAASTGTSQPFSQSSIHTSPNSQSNSRVKEMARLLDGQATICSYDSGYVPENTLNEQVSSPNDLLQPPPPPCLGGNEGQYANLPCVGALRM